MPNNSLDSNIIQYVPSQSTQDRLFDLLSPEGTIQFVALLVFLSFLVLKLEIPFFKKKEKNDEKIQSGNLYISDQGKYKEVLDNQLEIERKLKELVLVTDNLERDVKSVKHNNESYRHSIEVIIEKVGKQSNDSIDFRDQLNKKNNKTSELLLSMSSSISDIKNMLKDIVK